MKFKMPAVKNPFLKPVTRSKLVKPNEVPRLLVERRSRLMKHVGENGGSAHAPIDVPAKRKEMVLKEVFNKHWDILSPFFHPNVRLIGGVVGEKPNAELLFELAKLKHEVWGKKDGMKKSVDDYFRVLKARSGPTPTFVYFREDGSVEGAVFPVQVKTKNVTTWNSTTGKSTWKTDNISGDIVSCPMICSYMVIGGVGKSLIVEGVLPYSIVLSYLGYIRDLIAYSRPAKFAPEDQAGKNILEHLPGDPNYAKFHARNHARLVCVVKGGVDKKYDPTSGGYGFIAGYAPHMYPNKGFLPEFIPVLEEIGKTAQEIVGNGKRHFLRI